MARSINKSISSPSPWAIAAAVYLALTVIYLWPAFLPWTLNSRTQTRDAVLTYTIMGHTSNALFDKGPSLWNFEIFHPLQDMLCLSEPMLLPAVLLAPLIHTVGSGAAQNIWMYLCWFSTAMACWAYLRHRGADPWACLWGGICIAFAPDRLWHAAGHGHLFFQAGFPLVLLCVERMVRPESSRLWSVFLGLVVLGQLFSGFYLTAMFCLWCFLLVPAAAWTSAGGDTSQLIKALRTHGFVVLAGIALICALGYPVANKYQEFSRQFPQNPLEYLPVDNSATWKGYLLPPADPDRCCTPAGMLWVKMRGASIRNENMQFAGYTAILLSCAGLWFATAAIVRRRASLQNIIFWGAVCLTGLVAFILSLGPFLSSDPSRLTRLPFAYLYAWVPSIRFFRAPARLAFIVQWAIALTGAWALCCIRSKLRDRRWLTAARMAGPAAVILLLAEFVPLTRIYQLPMARRPLSNYLLSETEKTPFVQVPTGSEFMTQLAWHYHPMANGYSGYSPFQREQELAFFDRHFPDSLSLMLMDRWQVQRVFVTQNTPGSVQTAASRSPSLKSIWSGEDGVLYELAASPPRLANFVAQRRMTALRGGTESDKPIILFRDHKFVSNEWAYMTQMIPGGPDSSHPWPRFISASQTPTMFLVPKGTPLQPSIHNCLTMRIRVSNWYALNECGIIYWITQQNRQFSEERSFRFLLPADGELHELKAALGDLITWSTDDPVTMLRLDFGTRVQNEVELDSLVLESLNTVTPQGR